MNTFFHKSFKKIRITGKPKGDKSRIGKFMDDRNKLKKKQILDVKDEEELSKLESLISDACQDENREKVMNNFHDINGDDGNLSHQGVWKLKKKYFPKIKPSLPVGKTNLKGQLITNPDELKKLYIDTFKYRLRQRPAKPDYEKFLEIQEEIFQKRL